MACVAISRATAGYRVSCSVQTSSSCARAGSPVTCRTPAAAASRHCVEQNSAVSPATALGTPGSEARHWTHDA